MTHLRRIIAVFIMVLMSNFIANLVLASVDGPSVFWKYSLWGKRRAFTEGAETLSKRLAEETGGKFKLKIFYGLLFVILQLLLLFVQSPAEEIKHIFLSSLARA